MAMESLSGIASGLQKEWQSFKSLPAKEVAAVPQVGARVPSHQLLKLPRNQPALIVFLRHCGCPFAEKAFRLLSKFSNRHKDIHCIAVSHSSRAATDKWVVDVGGAWEVEVVVDEGRDLYAAWGLGPSSTWHALNPWALRSALALGRSEGIWNREAGEGGSRWQTSGAFGIDAQGVVRWAQVAASADQIPDLHAALQELEKAGASAL